MVYQQFCKNVWCLKDIILFGVFRPTQLFFTHMEKSQLQVRGFKFWPMLGTHGHWAVRVLLHSTPTVTHGICVYQSPPRTCDTRTYCQAFGSGAVTTCFYGLGLLGLGFKHPTFRFCKGNTLTQCATTAVERYCQWVKNYKRYAML